MLGVSTLTPGLARGGASRRSKDVRHEAVRNQSEGDHARGTSNRQFLGVGDDLLMLRDSSRFAGDFRRTVKMAGSTSVRHTTFAKSRIGCDHLPATRSALRRSGGPRARSSHAEVVHLDRADAPPTTPDKIVGRVSGSRDLQLLATHPSTWPMSQRPSEPAPWPPPPIRIRARYPPCYCGEPDPPHICGNEELAKLDRLANAAFNAARARPDIHDTVLRVTRTFSMLGRRRLTGL